ncbi:MAG: hypothetical protein JWN44_1277 [Myxococcales bacterium]|nr:hypothetical protein [Myxococcales bacterium]
MNMYAMARTMRCAALVVVALAVGGCFKPQVQNRSFVCDATAPACPTGFICVQGYCDDGSGGGPPPGMTAPDLAMSGGTGGNGGDVDMTLPPATHDLAVALDMSMPVVDMAQPIPDLAKPADMAKMCKVYPATCTVNSECCNNNCYVDGRCF